MEETLRGCGITLFTGTTIAAVGRAGDRITAELTDGTELRADRLLMAIGRRPS